MKPAGLTLICSLCALSLPTVFAPSSHAATPEARATLLTTTGPDHIASGNNTAQVMQRIRDVGLNTVYVETWKNGYTNFPSQVLSGLIGADRSPFLGTRDLVQETTLHAHRNELNYIGWFEYGLATQFVGAGGNPNNPISNYMKNNGWLLQDVNGNYANASNGFAWMNPAVPEVRQFLIDITLEAINNYDLDGVMHDDRLAWPREFGWDQTTKNIYLAETGRTLSNNPNTSQLNLFNDWRQDKVKLFAQELYDAVKAVRPDIVVSVSPAVTPGPRRTTWPTGPNGSTKASSTSTRRRSTAAATLPTSTRCPTRSPPCNPTTWTSSSSRCAQSVPAHRRLTPTSRP
ncbi:MAG: family 10 glycosylhydrolase [Phycisphaerales bacterium]